MTPTTPYSRDLGDRDPLDAIRRTQDDMQAIVRAWSPAEYERSYEAGKWTARQILTHLAHQLHARGGGFGLAAICIGVGQGLAVVLEA